MSDNERLAHVVAWRASGLSGSAYSKAQGLKYSTFMRWVTVLGKKKEEGGQFVELSAGKGVWEEICILLPNGVSVVTRQPLSTGLLRCLADV